MKSYVPFHRPYGQTVIYIPHKCSDNHILNVIFKQEGIEGKAKKFNKNEWNYWDKEFLDKSLLYDKDLWYNNKTFVVYRLYKDRKDDYGNIIKGLYACEPVGNIV